MSDNRQQQDDERRRVEAEHEASLYGDWYSKQDRLGDPQRGIALERDADGKLAYVDTVKKEAT